MLFVDDFIGVSELIDVVHNYCNCIYIFLVSTVFVPLDKAGVCIWRYGAKCSSLVISEAP